MKTRLGVHWHSIDPTKLTPLHASILQSFLFQPKIRNDLVNGKLKFSVKIGHKREYFKLTHPLVRQIKTKNNGDFCYNEYLVIGKDIGAGAFGVVKSVVGKLSFNFTPLTPYLYKPKQEPQALKQQYHFVDYEFKVAEKENQLLHLTPHAKPKLFFSSSDQRISYIVTKQFAGLSLDEMIERDRTGVSVLSVAHRYQLTVNILRALLEQVHNIGIAHRDLKPANIIIGENLRVFIIDYGLSRLAGDENNDGLRCGALRYAAPEVIFTPKKSVACVDELSDTYSASRILALLWGDVGVISAASESISTDGFINRAFPSDHSQLFQSNRVFSSLSDDEKKLIGSILSGMAKMHRDKRLLPVKALAKFEDLRISYMCRTIPSKIHDSVYSAYDVAIGLREAICRLKKADEYTLIKAVKLVRGSLQQVEDNQYALRELLSTAGIMLTDNDSCKKDVETDLQDYLDEVQGMLALFEECAVVVQHEIDSLDLYSAKVLNEDRLKILSNLLALVNHEKIKLSDCRRDLNEAPGFCKKMMSKYERFTSILQASSAVQCDTDNITQGDLVAWLLRLQNNPSFKDDQHTLRSDLINVILSFINKKSFSTQAMFKPVRELKRETITYIHAINTAVISEGDSVALAATLKAMPKITAPNSRQAAKLQRLIKDTVVPYLHKQVPQPVL